MDFNPVLIFLVVVLGLVALTALVLHYLPPPKPKLKPATHLRAKFVAHIHS